MLTVTQLARKYSIARATLLYYEREGLLLPKPAQLTVTDGME